MKNILKVFAMVALVAILGFSVMSCATVATVDGLPTPFGSFTFAKAMDFRGPVIAEYTVLLGLITQGYEEFVAATAGQDIELIYINKIFMTTVQAVAAN
jgi:hypothetical protein